MLREIKGFKRYLAIAGFREADIDDIHHFVETVREEKPSGVDVQFFDAKLVATWRHLFFAALNSLIAFRNDDNISNSLAMESLLYASAQRQIRKAMNMLGVKPNSSGIAVLVIGENPDSLKRVLSAVSGQANGQRDDQVLQLSDEKLRIIRKHFDISDLELETVTRKDNEKKALIKLVIERMALLSVQH